MNDVTKLREKKGFICDMDGVIYHGETLLPGVEKFVNWLKDNDKRFLFLTNSCIINLSKCKAVLAGDGV